MEGTQRSPIAQGHLRQLPGHRGVSPLSVCLPQGHRIPCELQEVFQVPESSLLHLKKGNRPRERCTVTGGRNPDLWAPGLLFSSPTSPPCPHPRNCPRHDSGGQVQGCPCSTAAPPLSTPIWSQGLVSGRAPRSTGEQCGPGVVPEAATEWLPLPPCRFSLSFFF